MKNGSNIIVGLDEVGRGCWAGPLVAVCFAFTSIPHNLTLSDSKLLTPKKRLLLSVVLQTIGIHGIGEVSPGEIDSLGLQRAQYEAYRRALASFPGEPDIILLDGRPWSDCPLPHKAIVKGDRDVASIAAASIVAKVYRDTLMQGGIHERFPEYGFNVHVGYGTKQHREALQRYGICDVHRKSYKPIQAIISGAR